jgi:hypothetical protein
MTSPRGIRNNNPGNIRKSSVLWMGQALPGSALDATDPDFIVFNDALYGLRALALVLWHYQTIHGIKTLKGFIERWAPPEENDTTAYVENACTVCDVQPDNIFDLDTSNFYNLVVAIIRQENGEQPYSSNLISRAIQMARQSDGPGAAV